MGTLSVMFPDVIVKLYISRFLFPSKSNIDVIKLNSYKFKISAFLLSLNPLQSILLF